MIESPEREAVQDDCRVRLWARVSEMGGRYLRVILLADRETIHNAFFDRGFKKMKVRYVDDTDTLYIEFHDAPIAESRVLDENTIMDVDAQGNVCAITLEHASQRTDLRRFRVEGIAA